MKDINIFRVLGCPDRWPGDHEANQALSRTRGLHFGVGDCAGGATGTGEILILLHFLLLLLPLSR